MLLQHFIRMLTQAGRRCPHARLGVGVLDRVVDHFDGAAGDMVSLHDHAAGLGVRMIERLLHVVDGGVRHPLALENLQPLGRRLLLCQRFDHVLKLLTVGHTVGISNEPGILCPAWLANTLTQDPEEAVVATTEKDVAILGLE